MHLLLHGEQWAYKQLAVMTDKQGYYSLALALTIGIARIYSGGCTFFSSKR